MASLMTTIPTKMNIAAATKSIPGIRFSGRGGEKGEEGSREEEGRGWEPVGLHRSHVLPFL